MEPEKWIQVVTLTIRFVLNAMAGRKPGTLHKTTTHVHRKRLALPLPPVPGFHASAMVHGVRSGVLGWISAFLAR